MTRGGSGASAWLLGGAHATRGHDAVVAAVAGWGRESVPHAILVTGPPSIGKTTLAQDLAAALLCTAAGGDAVPCGRCAGCLRVASDSHPDLHVLRPSGPGGQVRIGGRDAPEPGIRDLIADLALSPAEGGARVAIVESAHRMNEDAQNALLRTLEEPPAGVVIVLCADDEDRLLPTIRSRCVRVRLGPASSRSIEGLLGELGLADPPAAARLARLAEGRPGVAVALARHPDAVRAREELMRRLLDLTGEGPAARLVAAPSLLATAREARVAGTGEGTNAGAGVGAAGGPGPTAARAARGAARAKAVRGRSGAAGGPGSGTTVAQAAANGAAAAAASGGGARSVADPGRAAEDGDEEATADDEIPAGPKRKQTAAERRDAARALIDAWRVVARDLAVAAAGGRRELRDAALLEETRDVAGRLAPGAAVAFLARLDETERLVGANAGPELAIDTLLLAWPRATGPRPPRSAPAAPAAPAGTTGTAGPAPTGAAAEVEP